MSFALFLLRALIGALFVGHGAQKLFGSFGGPGPDGTGQFFESVGIKPGKPMAIAAGSTELGGGTLLALGLATPAAAAGLTGVVTTAALTVHRTKEPWIDRGGWEYNAVLAGSLMAIVVTGPGKLSLDAVAAGRRRWGLPWGLTSLAAGAAGAAALVLVERSEAGSEQAASSQNGAQAEAATPASAGISV